MSATAIGCKMLSDTMAVLRHKRATGKLLLEQEEQQWQLYFFRGALLYATGGNHRSRRWYRAVGQHCPDFRIDLSQVRMDEVWEYQLIQQGLSQSEMSLEQGRGIIGTSAREVFFALASQPILKRQWQSYKQLPCQIVSHLMLSPEEVLEIFSSTQQLCQQWQAMGLSYLDPDSAPLLQQSPNLENRISSNSLLVLTNHFNGYNTLWDIASKKKQCLTVATRILHHFMKQGLIEFKTVQDLPSPLEQWRLAASIVQPATPLIACIDDSRTICECLEEILVGAGYRVLKIYDPMQGIATLAKHKPALIFLDVVMPKADGFSVCHFLRKTPSFRDTPIVFLTGQDSFIDRTRAKITGATDFLSKPPTPAKVLQVVEKYLKPESSASSVNDYPNLLNPNQLRLANP